MQDSIWFRTLSNDQLHVFQTSDELPSTAEVVIVGAGMIGILTAYFLVKAGVSGICIVDRGSALGEASGANAGGLWFAQQSLELGPIATLAAASSRLYDELGAEFSFGFERGGMLELLDTEEPRAAADKKIAAVKEAGFRVERLSGNSARSLEPGLGLTPDEALYYPDEAHLHPAQLAAELIACLRRRGVRLCTAAEVTGLRPSPVTSQGAVVTSRGTVAAGTVVVAAGSWTPLVTRCLGWEPPIRPVRGTLLAAGPAAKTLHHTVMTSKYYYWQLAEGFLGAGGSTDETGFERGVAAATVADIRRELHRWIPAAADLPTVCAWSGFRPYCEDLKPVIGPIPNQKRTFVAAGHYRKGIMMAPVTGKILADLITGGATDLPIEALRPDRFPENGTASDTSSRLHIEQTQPR